MEIPNISDTTDQVKSLLLTSANENHLPLSAKDIYLEFGLRGYEFSGNSRGIMSCNNNATVGKLLWFREWSSYIDNMFQFSMLSGSRELVYGSRVQYLAINPIVHQELLSEIPNDDGLPVYYYKNMNVLKSGGIEARGIETTAPQRLQSQPNLKYERYAFVPYENPNNLSENPIEEVLHALTTLLHIVNENITSFKIKAIEIADGRAIETLMAPLVLDVLHSEPLVTVKKLQYINYSL